VGRRNCRSTIREAVTAGGFDDAADRGHGSEALVEGGSTDAAGCSQFGERPGLFAVCEDCDDSLVERGRLDIVLGLAIRLDGLEGECFVALGQFEGDAGDCGSGAMLDGQNDTVVAVAAEIEIGITPGVELRGSAQSLPGTDGACALLGMMDDRDGDGITPLQFAQEGQQRRDVAAEVFIDAVQTDERIEDEQPRLQPGDGGVETCAICLEIEAQAWGVIT